MDIIIIKKPTASILMDSTDQKVCDMWDCATCARADIAETKISMKKTHPLLAAGSVDATVTKNSALLHWWDFLLFESPVG